MTVRLCIAIVGSGPGGLSAAARAAELGISHVLLEAEDHLSHTISLYQKGKRVMAESAALPLRSPIPFGADKREAILDKWEEQLTRYKINTRFGARVTAIHGAEGAFEILTAAGDIIAAEHVVLAIGVQGNLRRLGIPGENFDVVQYQLDDPSAYSGETIVVVGAGDAGVENALALAVNNRVVMINRGDEFTRCKQDNLKLVLDTIREGRLECHFGTRPLAVEMVETGSKPAVFIALTPTGSETIACDRVIARLGAIPQRQLLEGFGVRFSSRDPAALPQLSVYYESDVPGLFILGALGGFPLIKHALNQGYEVVEYIRGKPVEPADECLLKDKLGRCGHGKNVSAVLSTIQTNIPLFADMTTLQLREFMLDSEVRAPKPGDVIFRKNDHTSSFFAILNGEVVVEIKGDAGPATRVALKRGQFFGEMGLLSGRRRSATVFAGSGCVLVETPRRAMLKLIASSDLVRAQIDAASLRRAVHSQVAPWISAGDLDEMIKNASIHTFTAGAALFREGDPPDGLHLIRRGSVMIEREIGGKTVVLSYLAAGNYVGEMALLSENPHSATVRAAVTTETILLPATTFKEVLSRNGSLRSDMEAQVLQRTSKNVARETGRETGNLIRFLMNQGLGEATNVLLIDQRLCVHCDNCVKACADTHGGTSRLDLDAGPTFANIHVPTSCRHCENPRCMTDCPPDAIHRNTNGEVFISDSCIGCGNCIQNCPYGVIKLAPVDPKRRRPSLWAWLLTGLTDEPGYERHRTDAALDKQAVKCDMCKDLSGGPACVRACPTGAAMRTSPEEFIELAEKISQIPRCERT